MNKEQKLKEIRHRIMHWCDDCDNLAYDYLNPCSGYQQEKCQKQKEQWVKEQYGLLAQLEE